eukprot:947190-Pleurochrysis_carterae.AAC.2
MRDGNFSFSCRNRSSSCEQSALLLSARCAVIERERALSAQQRWCERSGQGTATAASRGSPRHTAHN